VRAKKYGDLCENYRIVVIEPIPLTYFEKKIANRGKKSIFCAKKTGIYESIG
jgi:hypothetical protein